MTYPVDAGNDPAAIEADIARTRASLDRKLHALEDKLNPRTHIENVKAKLDPRPHAQWAAVAAVAVGTWMTITGLRRYRFSRVRGMDDPDLADMMGE